MLTEEQRAQIKARAAAATPGPWHALGGSIYGVDETTEVADWISHNDADVAFIAHAREDIPALLTENAHLRAILAHAYFDIIKHGEQGACFCGVCQLAREVMTQEEADHLLYPLEPPTTTDNDESDTAVIHTPNTSGEWRATVRCQRCGADIHAHGPTTPRGDPLPDPPTITCASCGASFLLITGPQ